MDNLGSDRSMAGQPVADAGGKALTAGSQIVKNGELERAGTGRFPAHDGSPSLDGCAEPT